MWAGRILAHRGMPATGGEVRRGRRWSHDRPARPRRHATGAGAAPPRSAGPAAGAAARRLPRPPSGCRCTARGGAPARRARRPADHAAGPVPRSPTRGCGCSPSSPREPLAVSSRVPVDTAAVARADQQILALADRLRGVPPVAARGVALARRLLSEPGPVYARRRRRGRRRLSRRPGGRGPRRAAAREPDLRGASNASADLECLRDPPNPRRPRRDRLRAARGRLRRRRARHRRELRDHADARRPSRA